MRVSVRPILFVLLLVTSGLVLAAPPAGAESPFAVASEVTLEPAVVIGGEDAPDESLVFYQPIDVVVDAAGDFFVVDLRLTQVKKFSPSGELLATFGREGEGPGELRRPLYLMIDGENNVLLFDAGNRRITKFDNDGAYLDSYGFQRNVWGAGLGDDGALYIMTGEGSNLTHVYMERLVRTDMRLTTETVLDSLEVQLSIIHQQGDQTMYLRRPYVDNLAWCVRPGGGVVVGRSPAYRLRAIDGDGNEVAVFERDIEKPELTKAARDAYIADQEAKSSGLDLSWGDVLEFPERKPYFHDVYADPDGTVIVLRYRDVGAPVDLDVFAPDGRFLHTDTVDEFPTHPVFRGDRVFGILDDPSDLPRVAVYGVAGSGGP